jgi:hypothetical protein
MYVMARRGRGFLLLVRVLVSLLAALPVGLAACGNDSSSNKSARSSTGTVAGTTAATGASGTTGTSGPTGATAGSTGSTKTKHSGGAGVPAGPNGGSADPAAGGTDTTKGNSNAKKKVKKKKPHFLPGSFVGQKGELYKQSKEVCGYLTLEGLAKEYNVATKTPVAVAQRYAQGYPRSVRSAVYKGCKAGLTK